MFLSPLRPSNRAIRDYLDELIGTSFACEDIGSLCRENIPADYVRDHNRRRIGHGRAEFDAAKDAIRSWKMFDLEWLRIFPEDAPIAPETMVAVVARNFGLWTVNPARIFHVIHQCGPVERFGFAYAALPGHAEAGEEQFTVEWRHHDDSVWYDLNGVSKPGRWFSSWLSPLTRGVQKKFAQESMDAMERAVARARK